MTQTSVCFPVSALDVRCPHSLSDQRLIEACSDFSRTSVLIWQFHQHFPFRSVPLLHVADRRPSSPLIHPPPPHAFKSKTGGRDWSQQVNSEHLFTSSTQVNILRVPGSVSELSVCASQRSCQSDVGKQPKSRRGGDQKQSSVSPYRASITQPGATNERECYRPLDSTWLCLCVCVGVCMCSHVCNNDNYALPCICFLIGSCAFALPEESVLFDSWHSTKCSSFSTVWMQHWNRYSFLICQEQVCVILYMLRMHFTLWSRNELWEVKCPV